MAEKQTVHVSPDGKSEYTPDDATQAVNLRARGWTPKPAKAAKAPAQTPAN